jgi:hypothetical protein
LVNDGNFRREDERGITSFGESSKATDTGAIGKFGFGQKAVFHLCDAFIVYAHRSDAPFSRPAELRLILAGLRHLTSIDIQEQGSVRCSITVDNARGRLLGPVKWTNGIRSFGGDARTLPSRESAPFVGREATLSVERLVLLQRDPHWPTTIDVRSPQPKPEKGEPHGAATLIRAPQNRPAELRISWAVLLPVSDEGDIRIPLGEGPLGEWRMLLHGYFFLDAGRREIEGLKAAVAPDQERLPHREVVDD